jgi:aminoglycoside phosphotransferase (APT) family kinase protein
VPERITVDAEQVRRLVEEQFSRWAGLPVQPVADGGWDGTENWFHGDVAEGNLLLSDGQLAAVIDFGTCAVGDMACDLAIAWTLLTADSQTAFRERLSVSDAAWARGRGWALWKSLAACAAHWARPMRRPRGRSTSSARFSPNTQATTGDRADSHGPDRRRVLAAAGRRSPPSRLVIALILPAARQPH